MLQQAIEAEVEEFCSSTASDGNMHAARAWFWAIA
jgi:hypothetical protein